MIAAIALLELGLLCVLELRLFAGREELATLEAGAARALLLVPLAILLGRNGFYAPSAGWVAMLLAAPGALALLLARKLERHARARLLCEAAGSAALLLAALLVAWPAPAVGSALAASALLCAALARPGRATLLLGWCGSVALAVALALRWGEAPAAVALLELALALAYAALAYRRRQLGWTAASVALALGCAVSELHGFVRFPVYFAWLLPAVAGLLLLLLGSVIQAPGSRAQRLWAALARHFVGSKSQVESVEA